MGKPNSLDSCDEAHDAQSKHRARSLFANEQCRAKNEGTTALALRQVSGDVHSMLTVTSNFWLLKHGDEEVNEFDRPFKYLPVSAHGEQMNISMTPPACIAGR